MEENWKVIKGFSNYLVSDLGRVISTSRKTPRFLKDDLSGRYMRITLCEKGKLFRAATHRLVAEAFLEADSSRFFVNHIDGDRGNNSASNLEWCTQSENQIHAYSTGLQGICQEKPNATKTNAEVEKVCEFIQAGLIRSEVLTLCPYITKASFDDIRSRRSWVSISSKYKW